MVFGEKELARYIQKEYAGEEWYEKAMRKEIEMPGTHKPRKPRKPKK